MRNSNTALVHINLPTHPREVRVGYLRFKVKQNMPKTFVFEMQSIWTFCEKL